LDSSYWGIFFDVVTPNVIPHQTASSQHCLHANERLFSFACDLYSHSRNRLSGRRAGMLLFI